MSKISVILSSANHAKYIREAIDSVLTQTFADFELIIWDDASTDDSWAIIQSYTDSRIKAFRNNTTKRATYSINKAISEIAQGEYIAIHHSDDRWDSRKLETQIDFMTKHAEVGAVFTNALAIDENGNAIKNGEEDYKMIFEQPNRSRHEWLRQFFYPGNALCHPSVLIRKQCYQDCGLYRFGFGQLADFDMWIRLCLKYEIHVLPEKLVHFRLRDNNANTSASRPDSRIRNSIEYYYLLKNFLHIKCEKEMSAIFPSAKQHHTSKGFEPTFVLAMIALSDNAFLPSHKSFGLTLLFDLITNKMKSEEIYSLYNFTYLDLVQLTAKHDVFSVEKAQNLLHANSLKDQQIQNIQRQLEEKEAALENSLTLLKNNEFALSQIHLSRSWKLILFFRKIKEKILPLKSAFHFFKKKPYCPICQKNDISFQPLPSFYIDNAKMHGYNYFGTGEMTSLKNYTCSNCNASDRERLYAYYLIKNFTGNETINLYHFAPEAALRQKIMSFFNHIDYKTFDLHSETVDIKQADLTNLKMVSDNECDFFICSHVLEHINDDRKAIKELYRITKPGGKGILMAPISMAINTTIENLPEVKTDADRWKHYGQHDHVRLYAKNDYIARIIESGFVVKQLEIKHFGKKAYKMMGLKKTSVLYLVEKH